MKKFANTSARLFKSGKYYALIGLVILGIAVVHFAMQITFIQEETLRSAETSIEEVSPANGDQVVGIPAPTTEVIEIQPQQVEVKKIEVIKIPEVVVVKSAPRIEKNVESVPARKPAKRKAKTETEEDRLRRAERLLTGF